MSRSNKSASEWAVIYCKTLRSALALLLPLLTLRGSLGINQNDNTMVIPLSVANDPLDGRQHTVALKQAGVTGVFRFTKKQCAELLCSYGSPIFAVRLVCHQVQEPTECSLLCVRLASQSALRVWHRIENCTLQTHTLGKRRWPVSVVGKACQGSLAADQRM